MGIRKETTMSSKAKTCGAQCSNDVKVEISMVCIPLYDSEGNLNVIDLTDDKKIQDMIELQEDMKNRIWYPLPK